MFYSGWHCIPRIFNSESKSELNFYKCRLGLLTYVPKDPLNLDNNYPPTLGRVGLNCLIQCTIEVVIQREVRTQVPVLFCINALQKANLRLYFIECKIDSQTNSIAPRWFILNRQSTFFNSTVKTSEDWSMHNRLIPCTYNYI